MEKEILKMETINELDEFEDKEMLKYRENFYNKLLENPKIKAHIAKLYKVDENFLDNVLFINGALPPDEF